MPKTPPPDLLTGQEPEPRKSSSKKKDPESNESKEKPPFEIFKNHQKIIPANTDEQYKIPTACIRRPGFNTTGTVVPIYINSYPITAYPDQTIFQYDVSLSFLLTLNDGNNHR
jgi:hypothetical protein